MKKPTLTQVNICEVDFQDRTYTFTFEPLMSQMVRSIKNIGLLHPPILAQISEQPRYRVVSGFKRILALIHLKKDSFPALVYQDEKNNPDLELLLLNFYENISIRDLNHIEKSILLNKLLSTFHVTTQEILTKYLPLMELGSNQKVLDQYLQLIRLEDNLKIAVFENFFSVDFAVQLLNYSVQDRQAIYDLFYSLKLGKNRQKEFVRLLHDISNIKNKSIAEIAQQNDIHTITNDQKLTVTQKVNKIREILRKQRFPIFSQAKQKFNILKKELKLPPNIIFRSSPFFENDKYSIEFNFHNQADFDEVVSILNKISEHNKLGQLETLIQ